MIHGINAGFGDPIAHEIPLLKQLRFRSVRTDVQRHQSPGEVDRLRQEFIGTGIDPLWIIRGEQLHWFHAGERVELLNEPNFYLSARDYADCWNRIADIASARQVHVYVGSISNLTRPVLDWFRMAWHHMKTRPSLVSIHRYPTDEGAMAPHKGFSSRLDEVAALRSIIGDTPFDVTEFGYHTARRWRWKVWPTRWTDAQTAKFVKEEWDFWTSVGVHRAYLYQLNDGLGSSHLDHYGIRRVDGTIKPSATVHQTRWTLPV